MSFDWKQFLSLAAALQQSPLASLDREAVLRTCIGRAYYSAFCSARDSLAASGAFTPANDERDHRLVVLALRRARLNASAERLLELPFRRNQCDYEPLVEQIETLALRALADAAAVISSLK